MKISNVVAQMDSTRTAVTSPQYIHNENKSMTGVESDPSISNNIIGSNVNSSSNNKMLLNQSYVYKNDITSNIGNENTPQPLYGVLIDCVRDVGGKEFVCGWGAALVNITITFPINKIIFRQMLHNMGVFGAYKQIKSEGILFLYRGVVPPLLQKSISTSLMFGMYENCREPLVACNLPLFVSNSTAAMLAGSFEALMTPFERVQTLLQDQFYHKEFKNTTHATKIILTEHGFKEFYRGFIPIVLRNGPSNVFFFGLRDYCNEHIPDSQLWYLKMTKQFMIGALIGTFISSVFYPFNVVKVHVQSRLGGPYQSVTAAFREVFLERKSSFRGFYRGVYMNCTRAFISWGVINVSYEVIKNTLYPS